MRTTRTRWPNGCPPEGKPRTQHALAAFALGALVLGACGGTPTTALDEGGAAEIGVSAAALSAADVVRVAVTITGPGITTPIQHDLTAAGDQYRGLIGNIPAGTNRTFAAAAYNASGVVIYNGQVNNVTIARNTTITVAILLQQTTAPDPFRNNTPNIQAVLVNPGTLAPGDRAAIAVQATDPDTGDTLSYRWTANGGAFDTATAAASSWTAPATEGTYALTIAVSDQKSAGRTVSVNVQVSATQAAGKAYVIASFNTWPEVRSFTATPSLVAPGATTTIDVGTFDSESDTVSLAFVDNCGGAFPNATTWRAPALAPAGGRCTLSVTATDGRGGTGLGDLQVVVGTEISANRGPVFIDSFQAVPQITSALSVAFSATAQDPENDALVFAWRTTAGTLGAPSTTGNVTNITWSPTSGLSGDVTVTVRATDTAGNFSEEPFTINVAGAAPVISSFSQSATALTGATNTVDFTVAATDADNDGLTFSWSASSGTVGTPVNTPSSSAMTWTAGNADATITARVTDSLGHYVERTFNVSVARVGASPATAGTSCSDILLRGGSTGDGVYYVDPDGAGGQASFAAYCDMTTDGGGWTAIFSGLNGSPNVFDHFETGLYTGTCTDPATRCLRRAPTTLPGSTYFLVACGAAAVKFPSTPTVLNLFAGGVQGAWTSISPTAVAGSIAQLPDALWTGSGPGNPSFILYRNGTSSEVGTFASTDNAPGVTTWDRCNGSPDTTSRLRVFYR